MLMLPSCATSEKIQVASPQGEKICIASLTNAGAKIEVIKDARTAKHCRYLGKVVAQWCGTSPEKAKQHHLIILRNNAALLKANALYSRNLLRPNSMAMIEGHAFFCNK